MEKEESIEREQNSILIDLEKNKYLLKTKYNNYFHLTKKKIYMEHKDFICTNIIQNYNSLNLYLALKNNSSGEGYIFNTNKNSYIKAHSQSISKLILDYKNKYLISCSFDKYIKIWEILEINENINCISQLKGHKGRIYDMDLITNKNKLISCGMDKNILIWDLQELILIKNISFPSCFHNLIIKCLSLKENIDTNDSKELILVYSKNSKINIVDFKDFKILETINICKGEGVILFINNNECIYQENKTLYLIIYNFKDKKLIGELIGCNNIIILIYKIDKVNKITTFDKGNNIKIWDFIKKICELSIKTDFILYNIYVDIKGILYCGSLNKTLIYN